MSSPSLPRRILLIKIRPDKLGDVLLATPLIRSLKEHDPGLELTMWAHPVLQSAIERNPYLSSVGLTTFRTTFSEAIQQIRRMRGQFDAALFLKDRAGSHIPISYLAGVPRRIGSVRKAYGRFLTQNISLEWDSQPVHEAELCYRLAERAFGIELARRPSVLELREEDLGVASRVLSEAGLSGDFFCLQATTGATSMAWSGEGFVKAARRLTNKLSCQCALTGLQSEAPFAQELADQIGSSAVNLAGQLEIPILAAVLAKSMGLVTCSTGTMHVAATQQTPCVLVQLPPDPDGWIAKWHPWMSPYEPVTPADDGGELIDRISVEAVVAAAERTFRRP